MSVRPGTPFPHTHVLQHSSSNSTYIPMSYFNAQPLHFVPKQLPSPTPPSLLNRTPSSSSSSSKMARPDTPPLISSRCQSSLSDSSIGSPILTTPIQEVEETMTPYPTPLELPSPVINRGFKLPPPEYNWTDKEFTRDTFFDIRSSSEYTLAEPKPKPSRPTFQRRDTPRPATTLSSLNMTSSTRRSITGRRLTSMVDGGAWIVMEQ